MPPDAAIVAVADDIPLPTAVRQRQRGCMGLAFAAAAGAERLRLDHRSALTLGASPQLTHVQGHRGCHDVTTIRDGSKQRGQKRGDVGTVTHFSPSLCLGGSKIMFVWSM